MNKALILLLVLLVQTAAVTVTAEPSTSEEMTENTWATITQMPDNLSIVKAAVVNDKIYVMTGTANYEDRKSVV
jgi:hypothetical protein